MQAKDARIGMRVRIVDTAPAAWYRGHVGTIKTDTAYTDFYGNIRHHIMVQLDDGGQLHTTLAQVEPEDTPKPQSDEDAFEQEQREQNARENAGLRWHHYDAGIND